MNNQNPFLAFSQGSEKQGNKVTQCIVILYGGYPISCGLTVDAVVEYISTLMTQPGIEPDQFSAFIVK